MLLIIKTNCSWAGK